MSQTWLFRRCCASDALTSRRLVHHSLRSFALHLFERFALFLPFSRQRSSVLTLLTALASAKVKLYDAVMVAE